MKKVLFALFVAFSFSTVAFACVCAPSIVAGFTSFTKPVVASIQAQQNAIDGQNIPSVEKSIELLKEENKAFEQLLAVSKENALKNENIIFELEKKNKLLK